MTISELFADAAARRASDLFLTAGKPPVRRLFGAVVHGSEPPVSATEIDAFRQSILSLTEEAAYRQSGSIDVAWQQPGWRYRLNFLSTVNGPAVAVRPISSAEKLIFRDLHLPLRLTEISSAPRGLILVVGSAGNGKSTTMNAMINHINHTAAKHIIMLEDPVEFYHSDHQSLVTQRELNHNLESFADALRSAMRESPDVIVIGEMRDPETVKAALSAALTGHLVLSTLHTSDAITSIERIIDLYPEYQRRQVAADLGAALVAVVAQRLLPRVDKPGMIPAIELLLGTPTVKRQIADGNYTALEELLRGGAQSGMTTFNRALLTLCRNGQVAADVAEQASPHPDEFRLASKGMSSGIDTFRSYYVNIDELGDERAIDMRGLLRSAVKIGASDLLLSAGASPVMRVGGSLRAVDLPELTPADTQRLLFSVISARQRVEFEEKKEIDFAISVSMRMERDEDAPESYRFRINGFYQRGSVGVAARIIESSIPSPETLRLPKQLMGLTEKKQGLILFTGPTGSGKSTTMAALVDHINRTQSKHIITIEDPIEYIHHNQMSLVEQREVHADTTAFATALKYALRQDPDVILVGEMRDLDTIACALTAAETGHLVLATLHTNNAPQTIDRIVDSFPAYQQNQIRVQLSGVLTAVVSQRLLPRADRPDEEIAAFEIMIGTPPVQALVREARTSQLASVIETGFKDGMISMRRSLEELLAQKLIRLTDAETLTLEAKKVNPF